MNPSSILRRLRTAWAFLVHPDPRKCRWGWHNWDKKDNEPLDYGDKRTCQFCGLAHYFHPDMGGVSTGFWDPTPYPEPWAKKPPKD